MQPKFRLSLPAAIVIALVALILYFAFAAPARAMADLFLLSAAVPAILPSVGRKVWFFQDKNQERPWDATIVYVHAVDDKGEALSPQTPVNLFVAGPLGNVFTVSDVVCIPEGADRPHYKWTPYQLGQAAKTLASTSAATINADAQAAKREEEGDGGDGADGNTNLKDATDSGQLDPERGQFEKKLAEQEKKEAPARTQDAPQAVKAQIADERAKAPPIPARAPTPTKAPQPATGSNVKK